MHDFVASDLMHRLLWPISYQVFTCRRTISKNLSDVFQDIFEACSGGHLHAGGETILSHSARLELLSVAAGY